MVRQQAIVVIEVAGMAALAISTESKAPSGQAAVKELHNQTLCPVMGKPIDSSAYTDIQGQRVYHCCKGCTAKLKADPSLARNAFDETLRLTSPVHTFCRTAGLDTEVAGISIPEGAKILCVLGAANLDAAL